MFILSLLAPTFASNGTWQRQRSGTLAWLHGLYFVNENTGWAVGSQGTLLSTKDGGQSWQTKKVTADDVLRDVYFKDESRGWLLCERNVYDMKDKDSAAYLLQTTDAGEHWRHVEMEGVEADTRLSRAVFTSSGNWWVFGEGGAIFSTRNSGATWVRRVAPTKYLLLGGTFLDNDWGWIVGAGATILRTSDGGVTWRQSQLPGAPGTRLTAASFVNQRLGWAVGNAGSVFRTTNGGGSWQPLISGVTSDLNDVKFLDASEGWAAGTDGTVIYTFDGGAHWTTQSTATEHPIEKLFFTDRAHGWAVGFGGTLMTYVRTEAPPQLR